MVAVKTARKIRQEAAKRHGTIGAESLLSDQERKMRAKQERARLRRAVRKAEQNGESAVVISQAWSKPLEEWDPEELAIGCPRRPDGSLPRRRPDYVPRAVYEEAIARFREVAASDLRAIVPEAIKVVEQLIMDDEVDDKGRMRVPPSVRLDAAKWVVEHLVGKPTQPVDVDVSVKLQGILANVMVSPEEMARRRDSNFIPAVGRDLVGDED